MNFETLEKNFNERNDAVLAKLAEFSTENKALREQFTELETKAAKDTRKDVTPNSGDESVIETKEYKRALKQYMRTGDETKLREFKALAETTNSGADGGYAVPKVISATLEQFLVSLSPMRKLARVVQTSTNALHQLVDLRGLASGWVAETAARPATNTQSLVDVVIPVSEVYANPQATQVLLDDVFFDAEAWLSESIQTEIARAEGAAFIAGDGSNKPLGILASPTPVVTGDASRAFGTLMYTPSGAAGAFASSSPADALFTMMYTLKPGYLSNASWLMNPTTLAVVATLKDSSGRYIFSPVSAPNVPATLLGYPVYTDVNMPSIAANSLSIAFGDFYRGYTIVDRGGMRTIRDPYSNKPYIGFYSVKRVGGALVNSEAVRVFKFAAS